MKRELIKNVLKRRDFGGEVVAAGWVRTRRDSKGGFSFLSLNDGSCFDSLQVVAPAALANYEDVLGLSIGGSAVVKGTLVESPGAGQPIEVHATSIEILGRSDPNLYPLQKQRVSYERLREVAHLRPRTNSFGAIARLRDTLAFATHQFFRERGFYYLHTPIITASDCEGAGQMFQVTTLNLDHLARQAVPLDYAGDFFGKRTSLTVSGQLEAETHACGLGLVYTFGPTFRAENSNTRRHLSEFWMVEPEMAFADIEDDADLAEDYLRFLLRAALEGCPDELGFFNERVDKTLLERLRKLAGQQFKRISYTEAVEILRASKKTFEFPVEWGADLQSEHERYLTEEVFGGPVTVRDYPKAIKAFYMRSNDDGRTVAAMDILLPEVGEIIGGSQREERLDVLESRLKEVGLDPAEYWWYLDLRRFGTVPHAGFGLGFERMVQFCSGMANIRDVIPFPRTPGSVDF